jgi:hypothetical protein
MPMKGLTGPAACLPLFSRTLLHAELPSHQIERRPPSRLADLHYDASTSRWLAAPELRLQSHAPVQRSIFPCYGTASWTRKAGYGINCQPHFKANCQGHRDGQGRRSHFEILRFPKFPFSYLIPFSELSWSEL